MSGSITNWDRGPGGTLVPAAAGKSIGTLKADIGLDARGLHSGVQSARSGLSQLTQSFGSFQGMLAGIGLSVGITQIVRGVVSAGKEFDSQLIKLRGTVATTREELSAYRKEALDVGMASEYSASDVLAASNLLKRSGLEVAETIDTIPTAVTLAMIAERGLAETTKVLTGTLSAMDLPISKASNLTDQLAIAHRTAKGEVFDYMEALVNVAPIARAYNYTVEETIGMLMKLAQNEIYGSEAGMKLGMTMAKGNEIAQKYGYESADIVDVLRSMNKEGRDLVQEFGPRFSKVAIIIGGAADEVRGFQDQLRGANGEGKRLADLLDTRFGEGLTRIRAQMSTLGDYIFQLFSKDIKKALEDLHKWILTHREDIVGFAYAIGGVFKVIGFVAQATLGPAASLLAGVGSHFRDAARDATESADEIGGACIDIKNSVTDVSEAIERMPDFQLSDRFGARWRETFTNIAAEARAMGRIGAAAFEGFFEIIWSGIEDTGAQFVALRKLMMTNVFDPAALEENWQALVAAHKKGVANFVNIQKESATEIGAAVSEAYKAMQFKSPAEYLENEWNKNRGTASKTTIPPRYDYSSMLSGLASALDEARGHWKKVQEDEELAKKKAEEHYQVLGRMSDAIRGFASEESASVDERLRRWEDYKKVMSEIIALDEKKRVADGMSGKMSAEIAAKALRDLDRERIALMQFSETGPLPKFDFKDIFKGLKEATKEARAIYEDVSLYQADALRSMLDDTTMTKSQMVTLWESYKSLRIEQITAEARSLRMSQAATNMYIAMGLKELLKEQRAIWAEHGDFIIGLQMRTADGLRGAMEQGFFSAMKNDWSSLIDYMRNLWDSLLMYLSQSLANSAMTWLGGQSGFGWLNLGGGTSAFAGSNATAGITPVGTSPSLSPSLSVVSEQYPVASSNWDRVVVNAPPTAAYERMRSTPIQSTTSRITAPITIVTPDVGSFKASRSQVSAQVVRALARARRNL